MVASSSGKTLVAELADLGAATIYEAQGKHGAIDSSIRPLAGDMAVAGRAFTVEAAPGDNLMLHQALRVAGPGDVLVVDARGYVDAGAWGDVLTLAAQVAGVTGLVIDGAVRDTQAIIDAGFPVFSRGVSIRGTTKVVPGTVRQSINLAGTIIHDGDIIVGDRDGLVVIDQHRAEETLALSHEREHEEEQIRRSIKEGRTTAELLGLETALKEMGW